MEERLQKILSQSGIASRRHAEEMIRQGRVRVNQQLAYLGQKADLSIDTISIDGEPVSCLKRPAFIYLLLNKPKGVVSTCSDPQGRRTVLDLLPEELSSRTGIHPVGRLDANSTGALILTNDGELTNVLTHPRHSIPKTYQVLVKGNPPNKVLEMWRQGVVLDDRKTRPAQVSVVKINTDSTSLKIVLQEGRNRQIRRVAELLGYPVIKLHRTAIGQIKLQTSEQNGLEMGCYRYLTDSEINFLRKQIKQIPD